MPKEQTIESAFKDWMNVLPFTQQALLVLALRGPDGMPQNSPAKPIIHYMRGVIIKAAYPDYDPGKDYSPDTFMCGNYENFTVYTDLFFEDVDAYPMHFLMHIIHAAEVIGHNHPFTEIRDPWYNFYCYACHRLHMNPETADQMNDRLKW